MGDALVEGYAEPQASPKIIWKHFLNELCDIFDPENNALMKTHFALHFCLVLTLLAGCKKSAVEEAKNDASPQKTNDLPVMTVAKTDGSRISLNTLQGNTVLVLFNPECDHCQREAKEIREHIASFKNYSVYFISADPLPALEKFGNEYDLLTQPNIYFATTTVESILNTFGPIPTPSVYIYLDQQLAKKFNGEVEIEKILQAI
jgi:thiol-disulfide isomerase/thioredoxin